MSKDEEKSGLTLNQQWIIVGISGFILVMSLLYGVFNNNAATDELVDLENQVTELNDTISKRQTEESTTRQEFIYKSTGIDPSVVTADTQVAESFFTPAFNWKSGEDYDTARTDYGKQLGEDNPFVTTYLAENLKVDQYNYIDVNELQAEYQTIDVYALEERGNAMDYLGVISYYMIQSEKDLAAGDQLTTSQAIVRYTVDGIGKERTITDVVAYPGFSNGIVAE